MLSGIAPKIPPQIPPQFEALLWEPVLAPLEDALGEFGYFVVQALAERLSA